MMESTMTMRLDDIFKRFKYLKTQIYQFIRLLAIQEKRLLPLHLLTLFS